MDLDASMRRLARKALAFANTLRDLDGRDPLPALVIGTPHDCRRCPVANTANHGAGRVMAKWEVGGLAAKVTIAGHKAKGSPEVPVPEDVRLFMAAFDAQEFPDLIDGASSPEPCDVVMAGADGLGA